MLYLVALCMCMGVSSLFLFDMLFQGVLKFTEWVLSLKNFPLLRNYTPCKTYGYHSQ